MFVQMLMQLPYSLCAGSITAYSLYGPLFLSRLRYTQFQVNAVSITAELAMYLPVPIFGYLCDRYSPRPLSLLSAFLFGGGYLLAALTYRQGPRSEGGWPFSIMILAFVGIGMGTVCMYLSAITTCAKNFGRGKHKGLALAMPIAAFGLSGMWQSQVGSNLLYEPGDGDKKGDVDVFRYFLFLAGLLLGVGLTGAVALRVVNEEELIDEAIEELERSGLLEDSRFFQHSVLHDNENGYGTIDGPRPAAYEDYNPQSHDGATATVSRHESGDAQKKTWLLNTETRLFFTDHTMWFLAAGFFLVTGPGEAFINNLGTIVGTFYPPPSTVPSWNSPATHVSIVALTSTIARLLTGTISDLLAPNLSDEHSRRFFQVSRVTFLLASTILLSLGQALLASGLTQRSPDSFPFISAIIGLGYGAVFSLTPIIVSVVWGVQNFGTNWGIVAVVPAGGAAVWGAVYSWVYQMGAKQEAAVEDDALLCYGTKCYGVTFWAMAVCSWVAVALWGWAWRGWRKRGVTV